MSLRIPHRQDDAHAYARHPSYTLHYGFQEIKKQRLLQAKGLQVTGGYNIQPINNLLCRTITKVYTQSWGDDLM
ncbi:hypothetical protein Ngar_c33010 [Candidatus Nitrososphaera gargensis Ga9.2]|uniref:Uncharacterized protein n=1 Tax=Nitrososphaera gargensis (strain Ga9.2) TaxID=1237085 RepID=K0IFS0_NITGG|nr:hypothetical protein Ngar_c33010 [Candidatus Nitrososphaera gargensis Ga9.2]